MLYIVLVLIGVGIGVIFTTFFKHKKSVGRLRVDHSDDQPYLFLELDDDLASVCQMDYVTLQVCVKNYVSHK